MPLPNEPWSTSYPTSQDTPGTEQPDLTADSTPGAEDGHRILVSHFHALRDKLQDAATKLGDDSNLPAGSIAAKVATLESAPPSHASSHQNGGGDEVATATPAANAIPKAGAGGDLDGGWIAYGSSASTACEGNDSRLSDSRTPTSHASSHQNGGSDEVATATPAANAIPKAGAGGDLDGGWITYGSSATTACEGNDSRLSDSRTPTSHASSHQNGGSDEVAVATPAANAIPKAGAGGDLDGGWITYGTSATTACEGNDSRLSDSRTPTSHASSHQNGGSDEVGTATPGANAIPKADGSGNLDSWISDAGASTKGLIQLAEDLGGTAAAPTIEGLGGDPLPTDVANGFLKRNSGNTAWEEAAYGSSANTVCEGNDSRLSDARTPTSHASSHQNGGGDEISVAGLSGELADPQPAKDLGTPVTAQASTPLTLTSSDSGKVYTNEGATAQIVFNLPTAAADLNFTFITQDADGIQVVAASGDTIRIAASATPAAGNISNTTIGNTVQLVAINATEWIATYYVGTWTVSS